MCSFAFARHRDRESIASRPGGLSYREERNLSSKMRVFHIRKEPRLHHPAFTVGRGPVPRHAAIAGDRPPRYGEKNAFLHVGRGPSDATRAGERVPLAMRFAVRSPHPCRSRSSEALAYMPSDLDPFGIRRSRTTLVGPMPSGRRDILVPIRWTSRPGGLSYRENGISLVK